MKQRKLVIVNIVLPIGEAGVEDERQTTQHYCKKLDDKFFKMALCGTFLCLDCECNVGIVRYLHGD